MKEAILVTAFVVAIIGSMFWIGFALAKWKCSTVWGDFVTEFRVPGGCMVNINGKFVPDQNVRFDQ